MFQTTAIRFEVLDFSGLKFILVLVVLNFDVRISNLHERSMRNFDYLEPTTVAEACALLKQHAGEAKVFAGGSHVTILMKQGLYQPRALVNIKKISELKGISFDAQEGLI